MDPGAHLRKLAGVIPIEQGGTGADTAPQAVINLQGIPRTKIDKPLGVAGTDSEGYLKRKYLENAGIFSGVTLEGPTVVPRSTQTQSYRASYYITNCDSIAPPVIEMLTQESKSTLDIQLPNFSFQTPMAGNAVSFKINGRVYNIDIVDHQPQKPKILLEQGEIIGRPGLIPCSKYKSLASTDLSDVGNWIAISDTEKHIQIDDAHQGVTVEGWAGIGGRIFIDAGTDGFEFPESLGRVTIAPDTEGTVRILSQNAKHLQYCLLGNVDALLSVDWNIATDEAFNDTVVYLSSTDDLRQFPVSLPSGEYWVRCRHSNGIKSEWSDPVRFIVNEEVNERSEFGVITDEVPTPGAQFGRSVSTAGHLVAIGAPYDRSSGIACGAVSLYRRKGFTHEYMTRLVSPTLVENEAFGQSVQITDDQRLIVGAPGHDGEGVVLIYNSVGDDLAYKGAVEARSSSKAFGFSVKETDLHLFVGDPHDTTNGNKSGAVHVYRRENDDYLYEQTIYPTTPGTGECFGASLTSSPDGRLLFIGACDLESSLTNSKIYVFSRDQEQAPYQEQVARNSPMPVTGNLFGASLDYDYVKQELYAGCEADSQSAPSGGCVYVFKVLTTPSLSLIYDRMLQQTNGQTLGYFGSSIAMDPHSVRGYVGVRGFLLDTTAIGAVLYYT